MRFLILNADYQEFLSALYAQHEGIASRCYEEQLRIRTESLFGDGGFYSTNLKKLGHEAYDLFINNVSLQRAWAREHGSGWQFRLRRGVVPWLSRVCNSTDLDEILLAQVKYYKPDILFNHAVQSIDSSLLRAMKPHVRLLVGQIASPFSNTEWMAQYDLVVTSSPNLLSYFKNLGVTCEFVHLGFEPDVLHRLRPRKPEVPVSFIGSFFPDHKTRTAFLEFLCADCEINVWGNAIKSLPAESAIRSKYRGHAWGINMYEILRNSKITLNHHTDIAGNYASNMRLYEGTGVGSLLVSDWKENLAELFDIGTEVVAYRSPEECKELIQYYLYHDAEREAIASAGQRRTLTDHTYYCRMKDLTAAVSKHL